jgi:AP-1-like transcription factor
VEELEKKSESANHENGLLRAQVTRLQTELREYRKRLSLGGLNNTNRSPSSSFSNSMGINSANNNNNNFQFEFPRFGSLPGAQTFDSLSKSSTTSPPANRPNGVPNSLRHNSMSASPQSSASPSQSVTQNDTLSNLRFDYGFPTSAHDNSSSSNNSENANSQSRVFRFNSTASSSGSPSASSVSQYGQNSSCGTSPEPSHNSPSNSNKQENNNLDTINEGYVCHGNSEGEISFCEKLNMACGTRRNPVPRAMSQSSQPSNNSNGKPATPAANANEIPGFDFLASQNGGSFDPLLFGDYRESQAAIVGTGEDFSNGFFNDAFGFPDINSPFNFGDTGLTPAANTSNKPNPIEQAQKLQDGAEDDEVVPGEDPSQMLSCHNIW